MKALLVFCLQLVLVTLHNSQFVNLYVLKGFRTNSDSEANKLKYVDNLLEELLTAITTKKLGLENPDIWPRDYGKEIKNKNESMLFDYIVVGAGTAGSVVASRLSEDPSVKVLLLEAGGNPPLQSEMHSLSLQLLNTEYTWNDYAEKSSFCCQAMKNERCYWPRGRMIGGTGGVNGNIFLTGYSEDFDEWQKQGNEGWSWNDIYPFYEKATTVLGNNTMPMGSLTLNHFERLESYQTLKDLMLNGTTELESVTQVNSPGYFDNILGTVDQGVRMSTGKTYLAKVSSTRKNLFIVKNAVATKILFQNVNMATGIEFLLNNREKQASARRDIIISAGTFNSPKLLMLSGVGPQEHLRKLNIPVVKNLPVGENFQDHGMMTLMLKFNKNVPNAIDEVTANSLYEYLMFQKGPLASNPTLIGLIKTQPETRHNRADIMLVTHFNRPTRSSNVFEFLQFKEDLAEQFLKQLENQTILEIEGLVIKPKSRGSIKLNSRDPLRGPSIRNNLGLDVRDQQTLLGFIRYIQNLQKTAIFRYYGLELVTIPLKECDHFAYDSNAYWLCYIKYFYISAWHAAGTCRMGPASDPSAVLDDRLRVHGIRGLRVVDASIMPDITSANTNGPTIVIAEKASDLIKNDWHNNV